MNKEEERRFVEFASKLAVLLKEYDDVHIQMRAHFLISFGAATMLSLASSLSEAKDWIAEAVRSGTETYNELKGE